MTWTKCSFSWTNQYLKGYFNLVPFGEQTTKTLVNDCTSLWRAIQMCIQSQAFPTKSSQPLDYTWKTTIMLQIAPHRFQKLLSSLSV